MKEPRRTVQSVMNDMISRINTDARRLRVVEQEAEILKSRMAALEQSMNDLRKSLNSSASELGGKSARAEDKVARMESLLGEMAKAMKRFAPVSDIKKLEQLMEIYSPLKSEFITRDEAERIIEEKLEQRK